MPKKLLVLLALCLTVEAAPPSSETLEPLRLCVSELRQSSARYHRWLPMTIFTMDRRLLWMDYGISFLEEDLATLRKHEAVESASSEGHVFSNAVEGCRLYRSQYEARARRFLALLACLIALVATLTVRLISFTLPGSKRKKSNAGTPEVTASPSDRPGTAVR